MKQAMATSQPQESFLWLTVLCWIWQPIEMFCSRVLHVLSNNQLLLVALVSVIIVADAVDRWALSYPILQSDNGDSANPGALWSLEVGRFLLAMTLVGVGALVLYRRPTLLHSTPYRVERGGIAFARPN